jgi:ribonuclease E
VLEHFNKALKADKARPQIAQLSELGLVELTRKRQGQNIYELFGKTCTACGGLGHTISLPDEWEPPTREMIEPPAPLDVKASQTQNLSDSFDIPSDNDTDDLDLMYHPNYQERGGVNRRRRRRGLNEPVAKEEPVAKIGTRLNPIIQSSSNSDLEEDIDSPSVTSLSLSPRTIIPRSNSIPDDLGMGGRSPILDSGERFPKSQIVKSPREIEPPKVVCVEMTTEEQDVYALMGISPLVRLDEDIRNPKSVILSVVLPGEGQQTNLSAKTPEEFEEFEDSEDSEDSGDSEEYSDVSAMSDQFFSSLNPEIEGDFSMESDRSEPPIEETEPTIHSESENGPPVIRRRRRRSSAIDGDDLTIG